MPLCGSFPVEPSITFLDRQDLYPTASTCDLTLRLPIAHDDYNQFKQVLIVALKNEEFGLV